MGDTVNLAQRLMELARDRLEEGKEVAIVVSEAIAAETQNTFRFAEIGTLWARGRERPVRALELVGERIPVPLEPERTEATAAE